MKQSADWLAWFLQGLAGMAAGAAVGLYALSDFGHPASSALSLAWEPGQFASFLWGAALVGAAIASQVGDRLWLHGVYRLAQPDALRQSRISRLLSLFLGAQGVWLIVRSHPGLAGVLPLLWP